MTPYRFLILALPFILASCGDNSGGTNQTPDLEDDLTPKLTDNKTDLEDGISTVSDLFDRNNYSARIFIDDNIERGFLEPILGSEHETEDCTISGYRVRKSFYDSYLDDDVSGYEYTSCSYFENSVIDGFKAFGGDYEIFDNFSDTRTAYFADIYSTGIMIGHSKEGFESDGTHILRAYFTGGDTTKTFSYHGGYLSTTTWVDLETGSRKTARAGLEPYPSFKIVDEIGDGTEWTMINITSILEYNDKSEIIYVENSVNTDKRTSLLGCASRYELRTLESFKFSGNQINPSSGSMTIDNLDKLGKTKITALDSGKVRIDIDENNDGSFDKFELTEWNEILYQPKTTCIE